MRYTCDIPMMKVQDPDLIRRFGSLGKILPNVSEKLEELRDFFESAVLDVFPNLLPENDPRLALLDCEYFRLSAEKHYREFVRRVFRENGGCCYWHTTEFKTAEMQSFLYKIKMMDRRDEMIYARQFELKEGHTLFRIEDAEILEFAVTGFLRELISGAIYFDRRPLMLIYNYDLSLPVLTESADDQAHYRELARACGLYFR